VIEDAVEEDDIERPDRGRRDVVEVEVLDLEVGRKMLADEIEGAAAPLAGDGRLRARAKRRGGALRG
jgi:hypothetical protein